MALPLEGVRIVDLSFIVAGPLASRLLADFGADVVRIESRSRIDGARVNPVRLYGELPGDANTNTDASGYFVMGDVGVPALEGGPGPATAERKGVGGSERLVKFTAQDLLSPRRAVDEDANARRHSSAVVANRHVLPAVGR